MWLRRLVLAAFLPPALLACGAATPTAPSDVPLAELTAAPTRITADGKVLTLGAELWRDFMPISPPGGKPLIAALRISTGDGSPVPAGIKVETSWIIHEGEVWSAPVEQRPRGATAPSYEVVARNGPAWQPGGEAVAVVRLVDSKGRTFLLRAPAKRIVATY